MNSTWIGEKIMDNNGTHSGKACRHMYKDCIIIYILLSCAFVVSISLLLAADNYALGIEAQFSHAVASHFELAMERIPIESVPEQMQNLVNMDVWHDHNSNVIHFRITEAFSNAIGEMHYASIRNAINLFLLDIGSPPEVNPDTYESILFHQLIAYHDVWFISRLESFQHISALQVRIKWVGYTLATILLASFALIIHFIINLPIEKHVNGLVVLMLLLLSALSGHFIAYLVVNTIYNLYLNTGSSFAVSPNNTIVALLVMTLALYFMQRRRLRIAVHTHNKYTADTADNDMSKIIDIVKSKSIIPILAMKVMLKHFKTFHVYKTIYIIPIFIVLALNIAMTVFLYNAVEYENFTSGSGYDYKVSFSAPGIRFFTLNEITLLQEFNGIEEVVFLSDWEQEIPVAQSSYNSAYINVASGIEHSDFEKWIFSYFGYSELNIVNNVDFEESLTGMFVLLLAVIAVLALFIVTALNVFMRKYVYTQKSNICSLLCKFNVSKQNIYILYFVHVCSATVKSLIIPILLGILFIMLLSIQSGFMISIPISLSIYLLMCLFICLSFLIPMHIELRKLLGSSQASANE